MKIRAPRSCAALLVLLTGATCTSETGPPADGSAVGSPADKRRSRTMGEAVPAVGDQDPGRAVEADHVTGARAAELLRSNPSIAVLDIRTPGEFAGGHIAGAVNIDFLADDFEKKVADLDKQKQYLVHCKSGGRSGRSLPTLKKLGFTRIIHLDDGFDAWKAAGHPVAKQPK